MCRKILQMWCPPPHAALARWERVQCGGLLGVRLIVCTWWSKRVWDEWNADPSGASQRGLNSSRSLGKVWLCRTVQEDGCEGQSCAFARGTTRSILYDRWGWCVSDHIKTSRTRPKWQSKGCRSGCMSCLQWVSECADWSRSCHAGRSSMMGRRETDRWERG